MMMMIMIIFTLITTIKLLDNHTLLFQNVPLVLIKFSCSTPLRTNITLLPNQTLKQRNHPGAIPKKNVKLLAQKEQTEF